MLHFSVNDFPSTASLKDNSGLPWGCCVQPLADQSEGVLQSNIITEGVARCDSCFAYINPFCTFTRNKWKCSLCQGNNTIPSSSRYAPLANRPSLIELKEKSLEYLVEEIPFTKEGAADLIPAYIAVVDVTGDKDHIELIKSGLLAAIEAMHPFSYFGLVTYSERMGVYDLHSAFPHLHHITIPASRECSLDLGSLFSTTHLAVQIEENKSNILAAIESLRPIESPHPKRGLGTAMSLLLNYLTEQSSRKYVRIMTFVHGLPNHGQGALKMEAKDNLTPQTTFYKDQAIKAAKEGICIDIFALSNSDNLGLSSIKFLSLITGGNISLYRQTEASTLPQDMFRQFNRTLAFQGLLRLRTSSNFKPSHSFGHLYPDENYENLYHLAGCDQYKTFTFDFEFTSTSGFAGDEDSVPIIQLAFSYTCLPVNGTSVKRFLRISTIQLGLANTPSEIYRSVDSEVVLCLLTHKIVRSALDDGIKEARLLLQDWLTILLSNYNEHTSTTKRGATKTVDTSFSKFPNMRNLSRLVFGLLKSPILSGESFDSDYWSYLHCLYRAIYPIMSSFGAVNNLASQHVPLSRSSVITSGCKLFLVDGFSTVVAYLFDTNEKSELPFPPPKDSLMRNTINQMKQERPVIPKIVFAKTGSPDEAYFGILTHEYPSLQIDMLLIEEPNKFGQSYSQFLEMLNNEV